MIFGADDFKQRKRRIEFRWFRHCFQMQVQHLHNVILAFVVVVGESQRHCTFRTARRHQCRRNLPASTLALNDIRTRERLIVVKRLRQPRDRSGFPLDGGGGDA